MNKLKYVICALLCFLIMFMAGFALRSGISDSEELPVESNTVLTRELLLPESTINIETILETTIIETTEIDTTIPLTEPPETQVVLEYIVEGGNVWIGGFDEPETDVAVLVTTLVEIPAEPETEQTEDDSQTKPETEPVYYEPIIKPERDDYETNGPYSPISLMYHSINEVPFTSLTNLFVRPVDFEDQLATLNELGFEYIFADEFTHTDTPSIILTFDDGYEDNYTEMFPLLKKYNAKATIFMITSAIDRPGYLSSEQIKEMADSGLVRFASHTHNHYSLTSLSEADIRYQFEYSKQILKDLTGHETDAICYPGGSITDEIAQIAEDYFCFGYTTVNSANTFDCDPMQIPRVRISRGMDGLSLWYQIKYMVSFE